MRGRVILSILASCLATTVASAKSPGLLNPACSLKDPKNVLSKVTESSSREMRGAHRYRLAGEGGGKPHVVDVEYFYYPHGEFFTRVIQVRELKRKETLAEDVAEVTDATLMGWIDPHLEMIKHEYKERRHWPDSFINKLPHTAEKYLRDSTYIGIFDARTQKLIGSIRAISVRAHGEEQLPVEEYLGIRIHPLQMTSRKVEVGALAVDSGRPESSRSKIWLELWFRLFKAGSALGEGGREYFGYADEMGLRMYSPLGWSDFRSTPFKQKTIERDGIQWRPIDMPHVVADILTHGLGSSETLSAAHFVSYLNHVQSVFFLHLMREFKGDAQATHRFIKDVYVKAIELFRSGNLQEIQKGHSLLTPYKSFKVDSWYYADFLAWPFLEKKELYRFLKSFTSEADFSGLMTVENNFLDKDFETEYRAKIEESARNLEAADKGLPYSRTWIDPHFGP